MELLSVSRWIQRLITDGAETLFCYLKTSAARQTRLSKELLSADSLFCSVPWEFLYYLKVLLRLLQGLVVNPRPLIGLFSVFENCFFEPSVAVIALTAGSSQCWKGQFIKTSAERSALGQKRHEKPTKRQYLSRLSKIWARFLLFIKKSSRLV